MSNFWDDEDSEFRDMPDETHLDSSGNQIQAPAVNIPSSRPKAVALPPVPKQVEYFEEEADPEEEDFSNVLSDARLRLEQGRLYEMIMNQDIFQGIGADERATKFVQKQIRNFAKEQMEIMLGMRQEPVKQEYSLENFPLNALEIQILKTLASTASKGATEVFEAEYHQQAPKVKQAIKPISLKTGAAPQIKPKAKPLNTYPAAPVQKKRMSEVEARILAEEGVTKEELDATFDPSYRPINSLDKMTEQEIVDRNRQAKKRTTAQVKSSNALPMPSQEQEEFMYTQRANTAAQNPQMQMIMSAINNKVKK